MSIWPEAAHDEKGVEILSDDLGDSEEEDVETTCIRGPWYNCQWDLTVLPDTKYQLFE